MIWGKHNKTENDFNLFFYKLFRSLSHFHFHFVFIFTIIIIISLIIVVVVIVVIISVFFYFVSYETDLVNVNIIPWHPGGVRWVFILFHFEYFLRRAGICRFILLRLPRILSVDFFNKNYELEQNETVKVKTKKRCKEQRREQNRKEELSLASLHNCSDSSPIPTALIAHEKYRSLNSFMLRMRWGEVEFT